MGDKRSMTLDRIGENGINTMGSKMTIVNYMGTNNIDVQFEDGSIMNNCTYQHFKNGSIKNKNNPIIYGKGYIGVGLYKSCGNNKDTPQYTTWKDMLRRCYSAKFQKDNPTYKDCTVYEEWLNFQTFAEWFDSNYYEIEGQTMALDKDWIVKGNKVYSPNTCIFTPKEINSLIINSKKVRGNCPIGVRNANDKYVALCNNNTGKPIYLGTHETPELAFQTYKTYKENHIKEIADKYKNKIPDRLYTAMYAYEIDIND